MGSTESTLTPMDEEQRTSEVSENPSPPPASPPPRQTTRPRRQRRATEPANTAAAVAAVSVVDDPWWWEIENENLILDQVPPNVSAVCSDSEHANAPRKAAEQGVTVTLAEQNSSAQVDSVDGGGDSASAVLKRVHGYAAAVGGRSKIDEISERVVRDLAAVTHREQTLDEFKEELRIKRLARQNAVQDLRDEIATLRKQLAAEQALRRRLCGADAADDAPADGAVALPGNNAATDDAPMTADVCAAAAGTADADDVDPMSRGRHANIELANAQLALQLANSENLSLRTELGVVQKQVGTLKEVIACCKQMLSVKEEQCTQLKAKLQEIETSFGERELKIMSTNLRQEYERQLGNIRQLRQLYEERQRIAAAEQENLQRLISIKRDELQAEQEKTKNFEERNQTLVKEIESANNELGKLREECNEHKFEKKALKEEMGAVNTLFSQMVMGFNGKNNLDIDRLTTMLEENRTLLNDMATKEGNCSDGATLPKLLFELVEQAAVCGKSSRSPTPMQFLTTTNDDDDDEEEGEASNEAMVVMNEQSEKVADTDAAVQQKENVATNSQEIEGMVADAVTELGATAICCDDSVGDKDNVTATKPVGRRHHRKSAGNRMKSPATTTAMSMLKFHEPEVIGKVTSAQEIIGNLPKVWKVLMELLSHHKIEQVQFEENGASEDCYKSVETANGPKAELSVSKTYIKLKDLILEKKSLVKETNRLKTLNSHLEYRLNEQEKRLSTVSLELTKTWHLVGKMQRQHRQLHTQEQILRYQLQQKRRLLSELKDELEYCRRKWAAARAKNDESQEQCNDLRREFAQRKLDDANNSAESGYSDSGPASDEEERAASLAAVADVGAVGGAVGVVSVGGNCRRKHLKEMFEHTRKIKRMQSTSPGRAGAAMGEIVLRWNSAPPTCGWRDGEAIGRGGGVHTVTSSGAIPKGAHSSRSKQRNRLTSNAEVPAVEDGSDVVEERTERSSRIQRLEEQCKSLIQQVLETSDNRERLEVQLCRFQDEIAPVQYPVPLDEFINMKRMTRASSAPAFAGALTPREEEYTRKRSERLERLEEESRQLMSRIKRTSDRGHYLRCSLDRLRRAPSREGSFESNTEEEQSKTEEVVKTANAEESAAAVAATDGAQVVESTEIDATAPDSNNNSNNASPLTAEEEAYTARRAARLQRLEEESKELMTRLTRNTARGMTFENKLDTLHEQHGADKNVAPVTEESTETAALSPTVEQRIGNIEKISSNREQRLRILEEEGKELLSRLSNTSERGTRMINRIAKRELQRQARANSDAFTPPESSSEDSAPIDGAATVVTDAAPSTGAAALMPTLKNVACSSIVCDELTDCVTVTTIPSQLATQQGAVPKPPKPPKTQPTAQLNAALRAEAAKKHTKVQSKTSAEGNGGGETLEEMIKRLKELPFPTAAANSAQLQEGEEEKSTDNKE